MTAVRYAVVLLLLGICTYSDIRKRAVYTAVLVPFFLSGILLSALSGKQGIADGILGAMAGAGMLLISFITEEAFGRGDALILIATGILLGFIRNAELICFSLFLSALFSAGGLILKKYNRKTELPFLPFLLAAFLMMTVKRSLGI